ncbi:HGxxPAAW family protein [Streptomyces sp. NPDC059828]|uniref:HGxxPAAW family protein n=1 Tax=Streptomyces sp. NPDC059828 TaxID=3346965 RepID=UPI0036548041
MAGSSHGGGHGHTPAAWTGVIISFIGFCVAGVFMVANNPLGFWAGFGVILLGAVVGGAMKAAGLGSKLEPVRVQGSAEGTQPAKATPAEATAAA